MPELTTADVELFTKGRLLANDPETVRMLKRAYAAIRRYCGWHVTPVIEDDVVTLDGPCHVLLALPTMHLVTLTSVVEDGITLDVSDLTPSASGRLLVKRTSPTRWSCDYRSIVVTMTHGFDAAPDFEQAVLELIDRVSLKVGTGGTGGLKRKRVDDSEREWFPASSSSSGSEYESEMNHELLDQFQLIPAI